MSGFGFFRAPSGFPGEQRSSSTSGKTGTTSNDPSKEPSTAPEPWTFAQPSSASRPSTTSKPSTTGTPSFTHEPSPAAEPSSAALLASILDAAGRANKRKSDQVPSEAIEVDDAQGSSKPTTKEARLAELLEQELESRRKRQKLREDELKDLEAEVKAAEEDVEGAKYAFDRYHGEKLDDIDMEEFWEMNDEFKGRDDYVRSLKALKTIVESSRLNAESFERAALAIREAAKSAERAALANEAAAIANERAAWTRKVQVLEGEGGSQGGSK